MPAATSKDTEPSVVDIWPSSIETPLEFKSTLVCVTILLPPVTCSLNITAVDGVIVGVVVGIIISVVEVGIVVGGVIVSVVSGVVVVVITVPPPLPPEPEVVKV